MEELSTTPVAGQWRRKRGESKVMKLVNDQIRKSCLSCRPGRREALSRQAQTHLVMMKEVASSGVVRHCTSNDGKGRNDQYGKIDQDDGRPRWVDVKKEVSW